MPSQVLSICGHSAVGKKTLIDKLLKNEPRSLRERFGVTGSIQAYGAGTGRRYQPLEWILDAKEDVVLHLWQIELHSKIVELYRRFGQARHRIILLWRPWHEHRESILARAESPGAAPCVSSYRPDVDRLRRQWECDRAMLFEAAGALGVRVEICNASTPMYDEILGPLEDE